MRHLRHNAFLLAKAVGNGKRLGGVQIGTLTCNAAGSVGFIFGSTNQLACAFSAPGRTEHYTGQISKFGVDIGFTQGGVLVWTVFAPTAQIGPGSLAGTYSGGTAGATVVTVANFP